MEVCLYFDRTGCDVTLWAHWTMQADCFCVKCILLCTGVSLVSGPGREKGQFLLARMPDFTRSRKRIWAIFCKKKKSRLFLHSSKLVKCDGRCCVALQVILQTFMNLCDALCVSMLMYCNRRNFPRQILCLLYFWLKVRSLVASCMYTSICDTALAVQKLIACESSQTLEYKIFTCTEISAITVYRIVQGVIYFFSND